MPGGEVQVSSGLATAHLGVPTVVVFHLFGNGKHANIHKLGQLRQRFYSLNFPAKLVTERKVDSNYCMQTLYECYLMMGLKKLKTTPIKVVGWTMSRDFRFFLKFLSRTL